MYRIRVRLYLSVLAFSVVAFTVAWILVSSASGAMAGVLAGLMLAVWLTTGLATLAMHRPAATGSSQPSTPRAQSLPGRLHQARARVMRAGLMVYLGVLGLSCVGLVAVWVFESSGSRGIAGVISGVLLAVWLATAVVTLVVVVLLVVSAMVATALKVLALTGATGAIGGCGDV